MARVAARLDEAFGGPTGLSACLRRIEARLEVSMKTRIGVLLALGMGCAGLDGVAQDRGAATFRLRSDKLKRLAEHVVIAEGNVDAEVNDWRIRADSLEVQGELVEQSRGPARIVAEGHVVMERGSERLRLRRLEFEPRTGRGVFELQ